MSPPSPGGGCDNPADRAVGAGANRGGRSDRHHLPGHPARDPDRQRQEAADDEQRRHRQGRARSISSTSSASAIPEEIRAAKRINSEGERIIEKAQEEAERIVASAQEQAAFLIEERGLTAAAEEASGRIIGEAQDESAEVRRGADEYAASVLIGLEGEVVRTLQSIKKGITLLDERRHVAGAADVVDEAVGEVDEDVDDLWAAEPDPEEARATRSARS